LAKKLNFNEANLYRMMSYLAAYGVFVELEGQRFAHNDVSKEYRDVGLVSFLQLWDMNTMWHAYSETGVALTSNENAFEKANGMDYFTYFAKNPKEEEIFQKGVAFFTKWQANIPDRYDFSPYSTVCDLAGGRGLLLKTILEKNPKASAILFDLPKVEPHVLPELKSEFKNRFKFVNGSFFENISCNADIFTIAMTLHCFDNAAVTKILRSISEAMKRHPAKLLIIEGDYDVVERNEPHTLRHLDNIMMSCMSGRVRTSEDWKQLTASAKLVVKKRVPIPPFFVGMECELAHEQ